MTCIDYMRLCLCPFSTWPIRVFNCHSLAIKSGHLTNNKWARGLNVQLRELPLAADNQLARLKIEQCRWIYLLSLVLLGQLSNPSFSFLDAGTSQLLKPLNDVADVGEVYFFLIRRRLVREGG